MSATAPVSLAAPAPSGVPSVAAPLGGRRLPLDLILALAALIAIVLALAIYSTVEAKRLAAETEAMNLAARQRMLSERHAKLLYRVGIGHSDKNPIDKAEALRELKKNHLLFEQTLQAFLKGGEVSAVGASSTDQEVIKLEPLKDEDFMGPLERMEETWEDYSEATVALRTTRLSKINDRIVIDAADATREVNDPLLAQSTELFTALSDKVQKGRDQLQTLQQLGVVFSALLLGYIAFRVIRNLMETGASLQENLSQISAANSQLASAQNELAQNASDLENAYQSLQGYSSQVEQTSQALRMQQEESDSIFSAVSEGLCLIDKNGKIGNQVSDEMFEIFETENLSDRSLIDLMRPLITERDLRSLDSYIGLQFDPRTTESQLDKFNPLRKTEVTLNWDGGGLTTKNLGFKFQRVYTEDDQISSVLMTVNDVTETVRLENELARAKESRERQTELIFEIADADPKELSAFLRKSEETLDVINDRLQDANITADSEENTGRGQKLVEDIFNKVHNIKGNASLLGLQSVVDISSRVEEKLGSLRSQRRVRGEELLASLVELAYLREVLSEFEELRTDTLANLKIKDGSGEKGEERSRTAVLISDLSKMVDTIGESHNKKAWINAHGLDLQGLGSGQFSSARDLIIQMVRNSMVHGIETPEERLQHEKWEEGTIQMKSTLLEDSENPLGKPAWQISYRDDGRGLDPQEIGERALELELISKEDLEDMSSAALSAQIFQHGFSSVDVSDDHAGRGAGMSLIRTIVNQDLKGKLRMTYETGEYLEFTVLIPKEGEASSEGGASEVKPETASA